MEFLDDAVILRARPHGETHAFVDILTARHGRRAGLVYGGQGRRMQPLLQPGNGVAATWRGRNEDSLGHFSLELTSPRAASIMAERLSLSGLSAANAVALACLPEREVHLSVFEAMGVLFDALDDVDLWPALFARWELGMLASLGFGLSLDKCVSTGRTNDLTFVSPKSGHAVCAEAGAPYADKLLALPGFLRGDASAVSQSDMVNGLRLTGYFIETRVLHAANHALPEARQHLARLLKDEFNL